VKRIMSVIILFMFSVSGMILFQGFTDKARMQRDKTELYYLPRGEYFKKAIPGFEELAADIYWIKTVVYFGSKARPKDSPVFSSFVKDNENRTQDEIREFERVSKELSNLYYFVDLVTDLDPYFFFPYTFGGLFLSMKAGEYDKAIQILEKGEKYFPDNWRLSYIKGFNYFLYKDDIEKALESFIEASKKPGCPLFVLNLSYSLMKRTGKEKLAIEFLTSLKDKKQETDWNKELDKMIDELKKREE